MPCNLPYEDCETSEIWREKTIVGRKEYRCCECDDVIPKGTRHEVATQLQDGMWDEWRRCPFCCFMAEMVGQANGECPLWGGLSYSAESADPPIDMIEWRERWEARDA